MPVGLLGLQGAFRDHIAHLERLKARHLIVNSPQALAQVDRLILPGGESTVMAKFMTAFALTGPLLRRISAGMPVWGICAGAILLAETVDGRPGTLPVLPLTATRNAYGRQGASTRATIAVGALQREAFEAYFIRAPRLVPRMDTVAVLAHHGKDGVFFRQGRIMATTFHPELTDDPVFHAYFLGL